MAKKKKKVTGLRDVDSAHYEVGHGKPPLATRFRKGRSGNPAGRPKKNLTANDEIKAMLNEKSSVRIGDKVHRMSTLKLALLQLRAKALKGDTSAALQVIKLAEKTESKADKGNSLWDGDIEFTLNIGDKQVRGPDEPLIERPDKYDDEDEF